MATLNAPFDFTTLPLPQLAALLRAQFTPGKRQELAALWPSRSRRKLASRCSKVCGKRWRK